jgi:Holliday junction resolvase RusA-like endonuclease
VRILVEGINPEPWTAPLLAKKIVGRKMVPIAYPKEELKIYKEAISETVAAALQEAGVPLPVFPKGTLLVVEFFFWRQLEQYRSLETGRLVTPQQPDTTNMIKATEDALQKVLYHNDNHNRITSGHLVECGPEVEPRIMVMVNVARPAALEFGNVIWNDSKKTGTPDSTKTVWINGTPTPPQVEATRFA